MEFAKPKFQSRQQAFNNRKSITLPLSQGESDKVQYAEIMQGYEYSDNFRPVKQKGIDKKIDEIYQSGIGTDGIFKVVPWGDDYVFFGKYKGGKFIVIELRDANFAYKTQIASVSYEAEDHSIEYKCVSEFADGAPFEDYFVYKVGVHTWIYSRDNYFTRCKYTGQTMSNLMPEYSSSDPSVQRGYVLEGLSSGATANIIHTAVDSDVDVQLSDTVGTYIKGEEMRRIIWEIQDVEDVIPATYNDDKTEVIKESQTIVTKKKVIIADDRGFFIKSFVSLLDGLTFMELDTDYVYQGDTISAGGTAKITKLSTGLTEKNGWTGILELDRFANFTSSGTVSGTSVVVEGRTKKSIEINNAPFGLRLGIFSNGSASHLFIGDIVSANGGTITGRSTVSYSAGYLKDERIPFLRWGNDYDILASAAPSGFVTKENDGKVIQLLPTTDYLLVVREGGISAYRYELGSAGKSRQYYLKQFFTRKVDAYNAISTPYGTFFISKDGLFKLNISNSGGRIDREISAILGERINNYDFSSSKIGYFNNRLYILFNKCDEQSCVNQFVLIYDINKNSFSQADGWNFSDICNDVGVGPGGGYKLFDNYKTKTRLLTKEYLFDRGTYIKGVWVKWLGGSGSNLDVSVKGRNRDGEIITMDSGVMENINDAEDFLTNPACNELGNATRVYKRVACHEQVESFMFDIKSDDEAPHELMEVGIDYTLGRKFYNC